MKKILFPLGYSVYPFVVGGMEIFNYYFVKSLSSDYKTYYLSAKPLDFNDALHLRIFSLRPSKIFYPLQLFCHLLFKRKIDTIVFSYSDAHWIIWYLFDKIASLLKIPYIVVIHFGKQPPSDHYSIYKNFFSNAKKVIAVSSDIKKNFDSKYAINSEVIYPLVPFHKASFSKSDLRMKYGVPQDANVICMVGTIKKMKNPDTIIDALAKLNHEDLLKYKPFIVFAGVGDMSDEIKAKVSACNLSDYVKFLGFIPKENVNEVMALSDIYLIASDFEGTSVSLLEAMYNGKAILASDVPGIRDTISKDECVMFPVRDSEKLSEVLVKLLNDGNLRERISILARKRFIADYSYERMINQYRKYL